MSLLQKVSLNDVALLGSLIFFCSDLLQNWHIFATCNQPIHKWLFGSCMIALVMRLVFLACPPAPTTVSAPRQRGDAFIDFMLENCLKGSTSRLLATLTWAVALPFLTLWTFVGTYWLGQVVRQTPQCTGSGIYLWFVGVWLLLCYYQIVVHAMIVLWALKMKRRIRNAEQNLRGVEDEEVLQRWGSVSSSSGRRMLAEARVPTGIACLSPAAIKTLPCTTVSESLGTRGCPICIGELLPGETVRSLPGCGHMFHRSCIDLWLVRQADCPLCKQQIAVDLKKIE